MKIIIECKIHYTTLVYNTALSYRTAKGKLDLNMGDSYQYAKNELCTTNHSKAGAQTDTNWQTGPKPLLSTCTYKHILSGSRGCHLWCPLQGGLRINTPGWSKKKQTPCRFFMCSACSNWPCATVGAPQKNSDKIVCFYTRYSMLSYVKLRQVNSVSKLGNS